MRELFHEVDVEAIKRETEERDDLGKFLRTYGAYLDGQIS